MRRGRAEPEPQERSLFGLTKPNIPHNFLLPPGNKKDPLSDILETGNEKDRLTRM